jgi:hypothetical protein
MGRLKHKIQAFKAKANGVQDGHYTCRRIKPVHVLSELSKSGVDAVHGLEVIRK